MTPEEYWNGEGIRFLLEDGTAPSVEDRVKEGFRRGLEEGFWDGVETMRNHGLPSSCRDGGRSFEEERR